MRQRVLTSFNKQQGRNGKSNTELNSNEIEIVCKLNQNLKQLLQSATSKLGLSGRAIHRILKVARTIADLANDEEIQMQHLSEAINYRQKINDRQVIPLSV